MTTAKNVVFIGLKLEIVVQWGGFTFGGMWESTGGGIDPGEGDEKIFGAGDSPISPQQGKP